jgi:hypothetical protein
LPATTNHYVNCGNPVDTQGPSYLTVSAWINTNTLAGGTYDTRVIVSHYGSDNSYNNGWLLLLNTATDSIELQCYSGAWRTVTTGAIAINTWYHVVGVYDKSLAAGSQLKLYLNGVYIASGTSAGAAIQAAATSAALAIGEIYIAVSGGGGARAWGGYIRDVRVHSDTALTANEIWQIYDPITRYDLYKPLRRFWAAGVTVVLPPSAPTTLTAIAVSSSQINLTWIDTSATETGFKIQRSTDGVTYAAYDTAAADATTYNDVACAANTRYWYKVCATNAGGDSAYSAPANAKTAPATATKAYKYLLITGGQVEQSDGRYYALVDGVVEPDTVVGVAWLYIDQADGDLKMKFGDGTVKVISADT